MYSFGKREPNPSKEFKIIRGLDLNLSKCFENLENLNIFVHFFRTPIFRTPKGGFDHTEIYYENQEFLVGYSNEYETGVFFIPIPIQLSSGMAYIEYSYCENGDLATVWRPSFLCRTRL